MQTENDLNADIFDLTARIRETYPELYRTLGETALPGAEPPEVDREALRRWLESLRMLVLPAANHKSVR